MKAAAALLLCLALGAGGGAAAEQVGAAGPTAPLIGDRLPELTLPSAAGPPLQLGSLRGRVVAISFFATYCGPCRQELPALHRAIAATGAAAVPVVIFVDAGADEARRTAAQLGFIGHVLLDPQGAAQRALQPRRLPCTFLLDEAGVVRRINRGFGPGYEARLTRWLAQLLPAAKP